MVGREFGEGRIFRGLYQGDHIATGFRGQWMGRSMAEVIPESLRAAALEAANFCAENGCAIYMIYKTEDGTVSIANACCFRSVAGKPACVRCLLRTN